MCCSLFNPSRLKDEGNAVCPTASMVQISAVKVTKDVPEQNKCKHKGKVYMVLLLQFQYQKEVLRFSVQLAQTLTLSYQMLVEG